MNDDEAKLLTVRQALIEGEESGAAEPLRFDELLKLANLEQDTQASGLLDQRYGYKL